MRFARALDHGRRRTVLTAVPLLTALLLAAGAQPASASHFRGGQITWKELAPATAQFTFTASFRRDGYSGTDTDGRPAVGDVIHETIGGTSFDYGDGTRTSTLRFKVIAINKAENYLVAEALEPGTTNDTRLDKTYSGATGPVIASSQSCCTISQIRNHSGGSYRVQTQLDFGAEDESAIASLNPIVTVGSPGVQSFRVPALDSGGEKLRFRLATGPEACGGACGVNHAGMTINPDTGVVSWDTTGVALGLYFASYVVESLDPQGAVVASAQQTILIDVVDGQLEPPPTFTTESGGSSGGGSGTRSPTPQTPPGGTFPGQGGKTPPDGSSFYAAPTKTFRVLLTASAPDPDDVVHIDHLGLPPGATFTPTDGNPATGLFEWQPSTSQVGDFIVSFTVTNLGRRGGSRASSNDAVAGAAISYELKVVNDTTPPVTSASVPACSTSGDATFRVVDEAGGTGAAFLQTSIDGGEATYRAVAGDGSVRVSVPEEGRHRIGFAGYDGNANAEAARGADLVVDRTDPTLSFSGPASVVRGADGSVRVTAADALSGLASDPSGTVRLDTDTTGTKVIRRTARDRCGNAVERAFTYTVRDPEASGVSGESGPASTGPSPDAPGNPAPRLRNAGGSFKLPGLRSCVTKNRQLKMRIAKRRLARLTVTVDGRSTTYTAKRLRKVRGTVLRLKIRDRNRDRKLSVKVVATLRNGGKVRETKSYRVCR